MKILSGIQQGSEEWLAARKTSRNASEAPSMMGEQSYGMNRAALLAFKATGVQENVSDFLKAKFKQGHDSEADARPLAEAIIGQDLFPVVGESDDGYLRASFDGLTADGTIAWEHKLVSDKLIEMIKNNNLSPQYFWQLEHQLYVSGAQSVLFMASDGTAENMHYFWYIRVTGRREALLAGWQQFDKDLAAWESPERNDMDWFDACERYRICKALLDQTQERLETCKEELIELAGKQSAKGCGLTLTKTEKPGSVKWAEVAKALNPPADLVAKYTGKASTSFAIRINGE
jgi:putative phage-type endonuclease